MEQTKATPNEKIIKPNGNFSQFKTKTKWCRRLKICVHSIKAMADSNIGQYELTVSSLGEYNRTIGLAFLPILMKNKP